MTLSTNNDSPTAGHNAGLHHTPEDSNENQLNIEVILAQYEAGGFPRSKLLIGSPFYARTFNGVGTKAHGAFQTHTGSGSAPLYRNILTKIESTPRQWDHFAKVPYLYNQETREWISYDDPQAVHEKALYSRTAGFGGVFFWRNGGDTEDRQLLTTISDTLAAPDVDADDLTDSWERSHFGDLNKASGNQDPDKDGQNNAAEEAALTDPLGSDEHLRLQDPSTSSQHYHFNLNTKPGVYYRIMRSTNLEEWPEEGKVVIGSGNVMPLLIAKAPQLLFRVELPLRFPILLTTAVAHPFKSTGHGLHKYGFDASARSIPTIVVVVYRVNNQHADLIVLAKHLMSHNVAAPRVWAF